MFLVIAKVWNIILVLDGMGWQMQKEERVRSNTSPSTNEELDRGIREDIAQYKDPGSGSIQAKLKELDKEKYRAS